MIGKKKVMKDESDVIKRDETREVKNDKAMKPNGIDLQFENKTLKVSAAPGEKGSCNRRRSTIASAHRRLSLQDARVQSRSKSKSRQPTESAVKEKRNDQRKVEKSEKLKQPKTKGERKGGKLKALR